MLIVDGSNHVVIVNPGSRGARRVPAEAGRVRARRGRSCGGCATKPRDDARRHRTSSSARTSSCPSDLEQALDNGATGHRALPLGVPVPQPRRAAARGRAVRGVSRRSPRACSGKPVTIRTFDLGADKHKEGLDGLARVAPNPALGLRAVRFCLAEPRLFLTQLRAILRASHYGNVRILCRCSRRSAEIDQTLAMIARAKENLREQGVPFDRGVAGRRHDRDSRGGARDRRVPAQARLPVDRHQRPDPVHARRRPRATRRCRTCTIRCIRRSCG